MSLWMYLLLTIVLLTTIVSIIFQKFIIRRVTFDENKIPIAVRFIDAKAPIFLLYGAIICGAAAILQVGMPELAWLWGWAIPISLLAVFFVINYDINAVKAILLIALVALIGLALFGFYQTSVGEKALNCLFNQFKVMNMSASTELLTGTAVLFFTVSALSFIKSTLFRRIEFNTEQDSMLKIYSLLKGYSTHMLTHSSVTLSRDDILEFLLGIVTLKVTIKNEDGVQETRKFKIFLGSLLSKSIEESTKKANRGNN